MASITEWLERKNDEKEVGSLSSNYSSYVQLQLMIKKKTIKINIIEKKIYGRKYQLFLPKKCWQYFC